MSLLKRWLHAEETETAEQDAPTTTAPDLDPFADYGEAIPEEESDAGYVGEDEDAWGSEPERGDESELAGEYDTEAMLPSDPDDTHMPAVFVNGPKLRHRTLVERLNDDLSKLVDRHVKIEQRIREVEALIAGAEQKVQDRAVRREQRVRAAKALARPAPTSVPEMFPRLSYASRLWEYIAETAHINALGDVEVSLSLTRLARDWETPRATVKHLIRAFVGKGVLVDLTPDANAAHVFKVVDPFGTLQVHAAEATVETADVALTEQEIAF